MPKYDVMVALQFTEIHAPSTQRACELAETWAATCQPEPKIIKSKAITSGTNHHILLTQLRATEECTPPTDSLS